MLCEHCKKEIKHTGLYDRLNKPIMYGNIVHWTDGGDDLSLEERIKTRWDRIAIVEPHYSNDDYFQPSFRVIDSPKKVAKEQWHRFKFGNFIYTDTRKYLTIVAENEKEYFEKFKSAGDCMKYVLQINERKKYNGS